MNKIVVNMLGGDLPLDEIINGINQVDLEPGYSLVLVGPKEILEKKITKNVEIVDATYDVESNTNPTDMMGKYSDSALMKSYDYLKQNDDAKGLVTMSGTGCVFVGALFIIGLIKGMKSASLACDLVNKKHEHMCVLDIGANLDSNANQIIDFAKIGNAYMKSYYGIDNPRIGLINLGVEAKKGNKLLKQAYELLEQSDLNFIGNVEFSGLFNEGHDVLVSDGLVGNAVLKNTESVFNVILEKLEQFKDDIKEDVYLKIVNNLKSMFDYNNLAGSFICGVNKIIVKAHGACNRNTIVSTINQVICLDKGNFIENLKKEFSNE